MATRSLIELGLAEQEALDEQLDRLLERALGVLWPSLVRSLLDARDVNERLAVADDLAAALLRALPRKLLARAMDGAARRAAALVALAGRG